MPVCVPVKDLRDTASFVDLVRTSPEPITVTKNGYDEFVCMRSADYRNLERAKARADLLARIAIAERERAQGQGVDAFEDINSARAAYGL